MPLVIIDILHIKIALLTKDNSDSKVHAANVGPTWGPQDPGEPHVGHMNFAIWEYMYVSSFVTGSPNIAWWLASCMLVNI